VIKKLIVFGAMAAVVIFLVLQLVPYGKDRNNPPVVSEPKWDSAETRAIAARACFDCHSHETAWPWYSTIAPGAWLIYKDVVDGREEFNFSNWDEQPKRFTKLAEVITEGQMPPPQYLLLHPEARLTMAEKEQLIAGLEKTVGP
jgi:mono/diheme cytochrome c family protein